MTLARPDLADERLRGSVAASRYAAGWPQRISAASTPIRRTPSLDSPIDTEALLGELVTVLDEQVDGWAWAQLQTDGYVGYVRGEDLGAPGAAPTGRVSALRTFVYPGPSLKLPPRGFLSLGATVAAAAPEAGYSRIQEDAYVFTGHLAGIGVFEPDFASVAERFVGTPYLWGGKTSLGLDCSGLIQLSLAAAGIAAPRDSDMQEAAIGEAIAVRSDLGGLRRGDLVFWKGHAGVMLDGERLLHANGHHMLTVIEPLREAEARIRAKIFGPITAIKRLPALGAA